ncbi:MAG: hypothetical protein QM813_04955 [Verrucomicrobiota bacterium]
MRRDAVIKLGQEQNVDYIPYFEARLKIESDPEVQQALNEAIPLPETADCGSTTRIAGDYSSWVK